MPATTKPTAPRLYHREGAPVFWALMDAPRKTFPGDTGDVADLMGRTAAGVRTSGATWRSGQFGNGLSFDGTSGQVALGNPGTLNLTGNLTISAWVNPSSTPVANSEIVKKDESYILRFGGSNSISSFLWIPGYTYVNTDVNVAPNNTFTHVSVSYNGAVLMIYINGKPVVSIARSGSLATTGQAAFIGSGGTGEYFPGLLDNILIYNRALSAAEVAREYADPWWRLRPPLPTTAFFYLPPLVYSGAVSLAGNGLFSVASLAGSVGSLGLTGSGSLSGSSLAGVAGPATLTGSGSLNVANVAGAVGTVALTGSGSLAADAASVVSPTGFVGSGSLAVSSLAGAIGSVSFAGSASLSATVATAYGGSITLVGAGNLRLAVRLNPTTIVTFPGYTVPAVTTLEGYSVPSVTTFPGYPVPSITTFPGFTVT